MAESTIQQVGFRTGVDTGTRQGQDVGVALAGLVSDTLSAMGTIAKADLDAEKRTRARKELSDKENEDIDYDLYLDGTAKISKKEKELYDSGKNPDEIYAELDGYINGLNIEFVTDKYKNKFSIKNNDTLRGYASRRNSYVEDNYIQSVYSILKDSDFASGVDDLEKFISSKFDGISLPTANIHEVRRNIYSIYADNLSGWLSENEPKIINDLVQNPNVKYDSDMMSDFINKKFPAYNNIKDSSIRGRIEAYSNKLNEVVRDKKVYNNTLYAINQAVKTGDFKTVEDILYSTDEDSQKRVKSIIQKELNQVDLTNPTDLASALRVSSLTGLEIKPLESKLKALAEGTALDDDIGGLLQLWSTVRNSGAKLKGDFREKLNDIEALSAIYDNNYERAYNVFRDGYVSEKLSLESIHERIKDKNIFFGSSAVSDYDGYKDDYFSNELLTRLQRAMRYSENLSDASISAIGSKISKQMKEESIKYDGKLIPNFPIKNGQLKFDTYIDDLKLKGYEDISVAPLRYTSGEGQQFMISYNDKLGNPLTKVVNLKDFEKLYEDKKNRIISLRKDSYGRIAISKDVKSTIFGSKETITDSIVNKIGSNIKPIAEQVSNREVDEKYYNDSDGTGTYRDNAKAKAKYIAENYTYEETVKYWDEQDKKIDWNAYRKEAEKTVKEITESYNSIGKDIENNIIAYHSGSEEDRINAIKYFEDSEKASVFIDDFLKQNTKGSNADIQEEGLDYGLDIDLVAGGTVSKFINSVGSKVFTKTKNLQIDTSSKEFIALQKEMNNVFNSNKNKIYSTDIQFKKLSSQIDKKIDDLYKARLNEASKNTGFTIKTEKDLAEVADYLDAYNMLTSSAVRLSKNPERMIDMFIHVHGKRLGLRVDDTLDTKKLAVSEFLKKASKNLKGKTNEEIAKMRDELEFIRFNSVDYFK